MDKNFKLNNIMNTKTGEIDDLKKLFDDLTKKGMSKDEAQHELKDQISSGELHMLEQGMMTERQDKERKVSKHDNRSHLGRKFANSRRLQRKLNENRT